jgi:hypothetical protein
MGLIPLGILSSAGSSQVVGAYELIQTEILGSTTASVTFAGLDAYAGIYKHLQIRYAARSTRASTSDNLGLIFNASETGYAYHGLKGNGSSVSSFAATSRTSIQINSISAASNTANDFAAGVVDILDVYSTSKNTTVRALTGATSANEVNLFSGFWNNTSALTEINLNPANGDIVTGSRFSLYGIRG